MVNVKQMKILFVDAKSSENYDFNYMKSHSLGGTESTVLRIARELARDNEIYISQINRKERYLEHGITYIHSRDSLEQSEFVPDIIIILRKYKLLKNYSKKYPNAKMFVWAHNFQNYDILGRRHWIVKTGARVICVSRCHQEHINKILNGAVSWLVRLLTLQFKRVEIGYIYNAIDSEFTKNDGVVDENKLLFLSTANKGLNEVLSHFKALLDEAPEYKLYLAGTDRANLDGCVQDKSLIHSNSVVILGRIPKNKVIAHLRNSFCVFYPQYVHPETFGLIYVEANCVGTPVLAHSFGSTSEVIRNKEQLVDARDTKAVVNKLLEWKKYGRPEVSCDSRFLLANVVNQWKKMLDIR